MNLFMWAQQARERHAAGVPFDGVKIDRRGILLLLEIMPGRTITWLAMTEGRAELSSEGVQWLNGRLTDDGGGLAKLHAWLQKMGLTFGEVELDLRRVTGWRANDDAS